MQAGAKFLKVCCWRIREMRREIKKNPRSPLLEAETSETLWPTSPPLRVEEACLCACNDVDIMRRDEVIVAGEVVRLQGPQQAGGGWRVMYGGWGGLQVLSRRTQRRVQAQKKKSPSSPLSRHSSSAARPSPSSSSCIIGVSRSVTG